MTKWKNGVKPWDKAKGNQYGKNQGTNKRSGKRTRFQPGNKQKGE